jgi:hypothetical protein
MSISVRSNLNDKDPYHIYLDLNCINNDNTGVASPPDLIFNEVRNSPILYNPSEYFLSVVRFTIQTPTLPIFIPSIKTGQANPNLTNYKITMSYDVSGTIITASEDVIFVPENLNEPTPAPPTSNVDFSTTYYYINNMTSFVNMVNTALASCLSTLNTAVLGAGGTLPSTNAPFLEYDPYTDTCILNADILTFNDDNPPTGRVSIFFNTILYNLFSSFQAEFYGYNLASQANYRIRIYDENGFNIFDAASGVDYLQMYQNYSTLKPLGNPVQSLVFSTGLIPVVPSLVSAPLVFSGSGNVNNTSNNDNINPILTDFETEVTGTTGFKPLIHYTPTAEYRLKDLYGNTPLSAVQMRVFWRTQYGNLVPFKLGSGCSANVKLLFRRKEFDVPIHKFETR